MKSARSRFVGDIFARWSGRVRGEAALVFLSRVANTGAGIVFVLLTARHLGPVGRGEITLAFTIAWATTSISNLGTPTSGRIRLLAPHDPLGARDLLSLSAALVPLQALLATVVVLVVSWTSLHLEWEFVAAVVGLSVATMMFDSVMNLHYGLRRYGVVLAAEAGLAVIEVAVLLVLRFGGWLTSASAISTMALGSAIGAIWLANRSRVNSERRSHALMTYWRSLIAEGLSPMLGALALFFALRLDRLILAIAAGAHSLGLYSVALAVPETLRILPRAFGQVIADRGRSGIDSEEAIRRYGNLFLLGHIVVLAVATVVAFVFLPVVFGDGFRKARDILTIVTVAEAFLSVHLIQQSLLVAFGRPRGLGVPQIVGGVVMVLLNLVMIPLWGIHGAAWAGLIGYAVLAVVSVLWTNRELRKFAS